MLTVAIIGRPNVGKSTFFNRVLNQRKAIVHEKEGITRDRIYGEMFWTGHQLRFVDTGGFIPKDSDIFNRAIRNQAKEAANEADFILFIVDGTVIKVLTLFKYMCLDGLRDSNIFLEGEIVDPK